MKLMPIKHEEKLSKFKIAMLQNRNKWRDISKQVDNLRRNIKEDVRKFIQIQK